MHKTVVFVSLFIIIGGVYTPASFAVTTESEKLQNKVNNFQENIDEFITSLDHASDLELPEDTDDDSIDFDADLELANLKYDEATPVMVDILEEIDDAKRITKFVAGITPKDQKACRTALQDMYIEMYTYQQDLEAARTEEDSSDMLSGVEDAINGAEIYLSDSQNNLHDILQLYLEGLADTFSENYKETLSILNNTYDVYKEEIGEATLVTFKSNLNDFNSNYSEGMALLERGKNSEETRDLQLFNRAIKKFLKAQKWVKKTYTSIKDLQEDL